MTTVGTSASSAVNTRKCRTNLPTTFSSEEDEGLVLVMTSRSTSAPLHLSLQGRVQSVPREEAGLDRVGLKVCSI